MAEASGAGVAPVRRPTRPGLVVLGGVALLTAAYLVADRVAPHHLPPGVVLKGLVIGGLNSLVAAAIILVYRSTRIINFAQAAIGGICASLAVLLVTGSGVSYYVAVPLGLALAVVIGWAIDLLIRWRFSRAPRLVLTVATIGILELLLAAGAGLPHLFGSHLASPSGFTTPFAFHFSVNPFVFRGDTLVAIVVVPVALGALWWFLMRTDTGLAVRGAADSEERARLLGLPVPQLGRLVWVAAAVLSALGAILSEPLLGPNITTSVSVAALLPPLAAAVLARMTSVPAAFAWSLAIGVVEEALFWSYHSSTYVGVVLFVVVVVALLFQRRDRRDEDVAGEYVAVREVAPLGRTVAQVKEVRAGKVVGAVVLGTLVVVAPLWLSPSVVTDATYAAAFGIVSVSLVILTGWAGQISLGQFAFVGLGAAAAGALMVHADLPFLVAVPVAGLAGAAAAVLIGLPALRIPGLFLAVVTLAFAVPVSDWLLSANYLPGLNPAQVRAPTILSRFDLASFTTLYEVALLVLAVTVVLARNLRRSRSGRAIVAVRDNGVAASAYGISPFTAKLLAFGISGFVAGVAGSIYVVLQGGINAQAFRPDLSITVFLMVVIGGLGSFTGGILGALYVEIVQATLPPSVQPLFIGVAVLAVLMFYPDGLGGIVFWGRDWVVAQLARARGVDPDQPPAPSEAGDDAGDEPGWRLAHLAALRLRALEELELHGAESAATAAAAVAGPDDGRAEVLRVTGLDVSVGGAAVVSDVTFGVGQSEALALVGTNGAGKTTVLRVVAGLDPPEDGTVEFLGEDVTSWTPQARVRAGLVTLLGGRGIFASLSVEENLRLGGWIARRDLHDPAFAEAAEERVLSFFPVLAERRGERAGQLSGGEQEMLGLAQALMCRPKLLVVDELSLGLAPEAVSQLLSVLGALVASGVTVIVVEQSVNVATALAERAIFLERGRVRFSGPTPELESQPVLLRSIFARAALRAAGTPVRSVGHLRGPTSTVASPATDEAVLAALTGVSGALDPGPTDRVAPGDGAARPAEPPPPPVLAASGVSKRFGGVDALRDVTVTVAPGEILGVIGANGAGKTTLLDVLSGFVTPDTGTVSLSGADVTALSAPVRATLGVGRLFQDAGLWPTMSVREALSTALERFVTVRDPLASALGLASAVRAEAVVAERVDQLLDELDLTGVAERRLVDLSPGTKRVVELGCALAHRPGVLLLDEPTSGITHRESEALTELLLGVRQQTGAAFIVVEHDVPVVAALADRMVCLHLGRVIADGTAPEVLSDVAVVEAYLGVDPAAPGRGAPVAVRS